MSRKQFDFDDRKKVEVPYSQLKHILDTRAEGSQDDHFVTHELLPSFKDPVDALAEALKHPIEVTGDLVLVVGRNLALALKILLTSDGDDDPKIPVEIINDIPDYAELDADDQLRLRTYAVSKDTKKDGRRGLKDADYLFNIQHYVDQGYSKAEVVEALTPVGLKAWRIEKLYKKAMNANVSKLLPIARAEAETLRKAGKPVNVARICERLGLPEKYGKDILNPTRRGARGVAINALKRKQKWENGKNNAKQYADSNFEWYTLSAQGTLATSDFPNKTPLSANAFLEITKHHLLHAQTLVSLWQGALMRATQQVNRLDTKWIGKGVAATAGKS